MSQDHERHIPSRTKEPPLLKVLKVPGSSGSSLSRKCSLRGLPWPGWSPSKPRPSPAPPRTPHSAWHRGAHDDLPEQHSGFEGSQAWCWAQSLCPRLYGMGPSRVEPWSPPFPEPLARALSWTGEGGRGQVPPQDGVAWRAAPGTPTVGRRRGDSGAGVGMRPTYRRGDRKGTGFQEWGPVTAPGK